MIKTPKQIWEEKLGLFGKILSPIVIPLYYITIVVIYILAHIAAPIYTAWEDITNG